MAYTQAQRDHYLKHKAEYRQRALEGRNTREQAVLTAKSQPCMDCGGDFHPAVIHPHHRPGTTKVGTISALVRNRGLQVVKDELAKCDMICANCHIMRHVNDGSIGVGYLLV